MLILSYNSCVKRLLIERYKQRRNCQYFLYLLPVFQKPLDACFSVYLLIGCLCLVVSVCFSLCLLFLIYFILFDSSSSSSSSSSSLLFIFPSVCLVLIHYYCYYPLCCSCSCSYPFLACLYLGSVSFFSIIIIIIYANQGTRTKTKYRLFPIHVPFRIDSLLRPAMSSIDEMVGDWTIINLDSADWVELDRVWNAGQQRSRRNSRWLCMLQFLTVIIPPLI